MSTKQELEQALAYVARLEEANQNLAYQKVLAVHRCEEAEARANKAEKAYCDFANRVVKVPA